MRVTLVRPPYYSLFGIKKPTYPIGLAYLATYIEQKRDHETILVDGEIGCFDLYTGFWNNGIFADIRLYLDTTRFFRKNLETMTSVMENVGHRIWNYLAHKIINSSPQAIGFSCYTTDVVGVKIITNMVRKSLPDVPVILGGPHVSALPIKVLEFIKSADYAIFGEGEDTLLEVLDFLSKGQPPIEQILGVSYRKGSQIIQNAARELKQDIDSFSFPNRMLGHRRDYKFDDLITTSRGCPYKCIFCTSGQTWQNKVRFRSVENVIQEISYLKKYFNTQRMTLIDDTFTLNKKRVLTLCKEIINNGLNDIDYSATSRVNTLDEEMLEMLIAAGFKTLRFGIESGSSRILKLIKKSINIDKAIDVLDLCNKHGIDSMTYFMVGHPTETRPDVDMSIDLFERLNPTRGYVMMSTPFPGTLLYKYARQQNKSINLQDYYKFSLHGTCVANISDMSDDVLEEMLWKFHDRIKKHDNYRNLMLRLKVAMKPKRSIKFFFRNYGVRVKPGKNG